MRAFFALILAGLLAGCGFHLRGSQNGAPQAMPFANIFISAPDGSEIAGNLKRMLRGSNVKLADAPQESEVILTSVGEIRDKSILSLNSAGRTREFQLRMRFDYRVHDKLGRDLSEPVSINIVRSFSFDDAAVNAKEQEEILLWRDMQNDIVNQIMRRLAATRLKPAVAEPG